MRKPIVKFDEELKNFSTFHIGGKAKKIITVFSKKQLIETCKKLVENSEKFKVIGLGANLLFSSFGYNGTIVINKSKFVRFYEKTCYVSSGITIGELIKKCIDKNLSGLENFSLIPSTLGGAITNNLGAYGIEIANLVEKVYCYKFSNLNKLIVLKSSQCKFSYRNSIFKSNEYLIIGAKLNLKQENKDTIFKNIRTSMEKKSSTQPLDQFSLGSVFKRTEIIPAMVIDELGLKGKKVGDAEVSRKHAGFIVNHGNATSFDVLKLIEIIKTKVKKAVNTDLELEIEVVE